MRLGKGLIVVLALFLIGGIYMVLNKSNMNVDTQATAIKILQPNKQQSFNRADDPSYAEELRATYELLSAQKADFERQMAEQKKEAEKALNELKASMHNLTQKNASDIQQRIKNIDSKLNEKTSETAKIIEEKVGEIKEMANATGEDLSNQFETAKDSGTELLNKLTNSKTEKTVNGIPVIDTEPEQIEQIKQEEIQSRNPFEIPQVSNAIVNPSGRVTLRAYGSTAQENTNTENNDGLFNNLGIRNPFASGNSSSAAGLSFTASQTKNPFEVGVGAKTAKPAPIPIYTIPDTATLVVNSSMTPLIGKVPNRASSVPDPYRFKIITGADNLATNGITIPGIDNIVWSGWAVGVRELSCTRGYVDTVTYTFKDGRIKTITSGKSQGGSSDQNLGYLTDAWGKPCIRGQLISNASDYLKDRAGSSFLSGAAAAIAQAQTTSQIDSNGGTSTVVNGDTGKYILGAGISDTANEIAQYVKERAVNAFDVVFVPTGVNVQLFIEKQIEIDYDPSGRKISYDYSKNTRSSRKLD